MKYIRNFIAAIIFTFIKFYFKLKLKDKSPQRKILFVNLGLIGDVILTSIIIANEINFLDDYKFTVLSNINNKSLFENYHGKILLKFVDIPAYKTSFKYRIKFLESLLRERFERVYNLSFTRLAIDDEVSIISGLYGQTMAYKNNKNLKRILGNVFDRTYTSLIDRKHASDLLNYAELIKNHLKSDREVIERTIIFPHKVNIENKFDLAPNNYFVISPFSSHRIKNWPLEKYILLSVKLAQMSELICVVLGDEKFESEDLDGNNFKNLLGRTNLSEAINIIKHSRFFIGNDSGLLHVAIALRKDSFGIIGGGAWGRIYPYHKHDRTNYFYAYRECFTCDWECIYKDPFCLTEINEKKIYDEISEVIIQRGLNKNLSKNN